MVLKKYSSQMLRLNLTSSISVEVTIQVLLEQLLSRGSGGQWVTMMTGKITTSFGPSGNRIKS